VLRQKPLNRDIKKGISAMKEHAENQETSAARMEDLEGAMPPETKPKPTEDIDARTDDTEGKIHSLESEQTPSVTETVSMRQADKGEPAGDQSIEKVRDILFGSQTRRFEQRIASHEALFEQEIARLRSDSKRNLESLENYVKKEIGSLTGSLSAEQKIRTEAVESLAEKLNGTTRALEQKIEQFHQNISAIQSNMQEQILEQSKKLMGEISEKYEKISSVHEQALKELRKEKSDSLALANLFIEMGMRLKEEFEIPGME